MVSTPLLALVAACLGLAAGAAARRKIGSAGCGKNIPSGHELGQDLAVNVSSGGDSRNYRIYLPPTYTEDEPSPLVISYHGGLRNASWQTGLDGIVDEPFFNKHYIVVHPDGLNMSWQGTPDKETGNDIQFTSDFLDDIEGRYCVDTLRIFATGKSNGGGFVNLAACDPQLSTRIAAFAPVSGSFYVYDITGPDCDPETVRLPCSPGRDDVAVMEFHGGADTTIPYYGNATRKDACLPAIPHWAREWAGRNRIGGDPAVRTLPGSGAAVVLFEWGSGARKGLVSQVFDPGLAHSWPSTAPNLDTEEKGEEPASYNATHVMLEFFEKHPLATSHAERRWNPVGAVWRRVEQGLRRLGLARKARRGERSFVGRRAKVRGDGTAVSRVGREERAQVAHV